MWKEPLGKAKPTELGKEMSAALSLPVCTSKCAFVAGLSELLLTVIMF